MVSSRLGAWGSRCLFENGGSVFDWFFSSNRPLVLFLGGLFFAGFYLLPFLVAAETLQGFSMVKNATIVPKILRFLLMWLKNAHC